MGNSMGRCCGPSSVKKMGDKVRVLQTEIKPLFAGSSSSPARSVLRDPKVAILHLLDVKIKGGEEISGGVGRGKPSAYAKV